MKPKVSSILATAFIASLALTGCAQGNSSQTNADSSDTQGTESLTIAMVASACLGLYPTYVAQEQGYFAENGLDVNIQPANGSAAVLQALLSGQADLGTPGATPMIFTVAEGGEVVHIANTMPSGAFSLIALTESGITTAQDLKGKTIGISTADGGEAAFLKAALADAGLAESDYKTLVVGEAGQAVAGFHRGDIDVFAAAPDGVATLATAGLDVTTLTGSSPGHMFGNGLAARTELVEERPEVAQKFWDAYKKATEFGQENPEQVMEACENYQPQEVEDEAFATAMIGAFNASLATVDGSAYGTHNPEHWQKIVDGLVEGGELEEGAVDVDSLFTNQFVE